ncbi:MAG: lipoate--protein ligase family protein, partial [Planctomycetes bacterium]|nr:lipoate--protein ligase family protein [Planctomycetota bacterium]
VLAWSEALLDDAPSDRPLLALWRPAGKSVAIGISQSPERELDVAALQRDGVELVRRQSGGGAVLLFGGVLCWEALARMDVMDRMGGSGIRESYRVLCRPVVNALQAMGIDAFHAGVCDISCTTGPDHPVYKLAGTAQLRRRGMALVHGSLLVTADVSELGRYLRQPSEEPDYRAGRGHDDFCRTVADRVGAGDGGATDADVFRRVVAAIVAAAGRLGFDLATPPSSLNPTATRLLEEKYRKDDWNWRRIRPK